MRLIVICERKFADRAKNVLFGLTGLSQFISPEQATQLLRRLPINRSSVAVMVWIRADNDQLKSVVSELNSKRLPYFLILAGQRLPNWLAHAAPNDVAFSGSSKNHIRGRLMRFLHTHDWLSDTNEPIVFSTNAFGGQRAIDPSSIRLISSDGDYVVVEANSASFLVRTTLSNLALVLDSTKFVRLHRTHIVPISDIKTIRPRAKASIDVELVDGRRIPVGRTYARNLRQLHIGACCNQTTLTQQGQVDDQ
jgi:hypothetical protein